MTRKYDGKHEMDIGYFDHIEGRSVGQPVALFHKAQVGYPLTPGYDPEIILTREELDARINWRRREDL